MSNKDLSKDDRIKKEKQKLRRLFAKMDNKTKQSVESLLDNAAFMAVTLEELQEVLNKEGVVSKYQNGEHQWGTKKAPEVEVYNSMIKNYSGIIKQLTDLLPPPEPPQKDDGFDKFVSSK